MSKKPNIWRIRSAFTKLEHQRIFKAFMADLEVQRAKPKPSPLSAGLLAAASRADGNTYQRAIEDLADDETGYST